MELIKLLGSFLSQSEVNSILSTNINITTLVSKITNISNVVTDPFKFTDDLYKLQEMGVVVNSSSDLEKVKSIPPNNLLNNSVDVIKLSENISKLEKNGVQLSNYTNQITTIKDSGVDINKILNFGLNFSSPVNNIQSNIQNQGNSLSNSLQSHVSGLGNSVVNNLQGQGSNLLNQGRNLTSNLQGQGQNLVSNLQGQGSNLLNQGKNLTSNLQDQGQNIVNNIQGQGAGLLKADGLLNPSEVRKKGIQILVPSQYLDVYELSKWGGEPALVTTKESKQLVWYDKSFDRPDFVPDNLVNPARESADGNGDFGINIRLGYPGGKKVGNWSEDGTQCFSTAEELRDFFTLCEKHKELHGNKFTYTLATKDDWEQATKNVQANKLAPKETPEEINKNKTTVLAPVSEMKMPRSVVMEDDKFDNPLIGSISEIQPLNDVKTENSTSTTEKVEVATPSGSNEVTKPKTPDKPSEFKKTLDIISFQNWGNKNTSKYKIKLEVDGKWSENTDKLWKTTKNDYLKDLKGSFTTLPKILNDSNLRLTHSRFYPYGEMTISDDGVNPSYILTFNIDYKNKKLQNSTTIDWSKAYALIALVNGRYKIYDNKTRSYISEGTYLDGFRSITITTGRNKGKTIKDNNAWDAIYKSLF